MVWEKRFSQYLSDVPQHRASWASPAVDPETGNIYLFTVSAQLVCLAPDGKILWDRSLPDEYGAVTTHGGRTVSPIIEGDKVFLNALVMAWGDLNRTGNRFFAFDKKTGQTVWIASPQVRHYDTNYSTPIVSTIDGTRALIVGGTDGGYHALKLNTGERMWSIDVSKRAILNSPLFRDNVAYITHGEENLDTTEMGMIAAVDATRSGVLTRRGVQVADARVPARRFASPVADAERLYTVDNSAIVGAFDLKTGAKLWEKTLGTLQKGSPVLADGKLYVGTENGKFYILRPSATGVEVLDEDVLGHGADAGADRRLADRRRRPHLRHDAWTRCMPLASASRGRRGAPRASGAPGAAAAPGAPAVVQVFPYETLLTPGQTVTLKARLFDAKGNFIREEPAAQWTVEQLTGAVDAKGTYTAAKTGSTAGVVKATVGGISGTARVRVIEPLPWSWDFDGATAEAPPAWWMGAPGKVFQRTVDGAGKVLMRPARRNRRAPRQGLLRRAEPGRLHRRGRRARRANSAGSAATSA